MQVYVYTLSFGSLCAHRSENPRGNTSACPPAKPESVATPDPAVRENWNEPPKVGCAIFNHYYTLACEALRPIDTVRAVYVPTESAKRIWIRSWIYEEAHIQICLRNQENILAVWHVGPEGRYGKRPS